MAELDGRGDPHESDTVKLPAIIYFESPSYTQVHTAEGRRKTRLWKKGLEAKYGLYNSDLEHQCSETCFRPLHLANEEVNKELWALSSTFKTRNMDPRMRRRMRPWNLGSDTVVTTEERRAQEFAEQEAWTLSQEKRLALSPQMKNDDDDGVYVEEIDVKLGLYGCPRSANVHVCDLNYLIRQERCLLRVEERDGSIACRYSGRFIFSAMPLFNPYTETTISIYSNQEYEAMNAPTADEKKVQREANAQPPHDPLLSLQKTTLKRQDVGLAKSLTQRIERLTVRQEPAAHSVVPSLAIPHDYQGSPNKRLTRSDMPIPKSDSSTTPLRTVKTANTSNVDPVAFLTKLSASQNPPPSAAEVSGSTPAARKPPLTLPFGLVVKRDAMSKIKTVVTHVLADPDARAHVKGSTEALDPANIPEHANYITLYCVRTAIIMALLNSENLRDRELSRTAPGRKRNQLAAVNTRNLTITVLYLYSRGYNILSGQNFIQADPLLGKMLPVPRDLCWFGLEKEMLREIGAVSFKANTGASELLKNIQIYEMGMATSELAKIQQVINTFIDPFAFGQKTLERMLNVQSTMLEHFGVNGLSEVREHYGKQDTKGDADSFYGYGTSDGSDGQSFTEKYYQRQDDDDDHDAWA